MGIFDFISSLIKPATDLVDNLTTSKEEKLELANKLKEIEAGVKAKIIEYNTKLMDAQAKVLLAEAQGQGWLQRSWRPLTMLTFLVLVVCDNFGILAFRLSNEAWALLKIGLGGYVAGRSLEKITSSVKEIVKK